VQESRHGGQTPGLRAGARDTGDHVPARGRRTDAPGGIRPLDWPAGRAHRAGGAWWVVHAGAWLSRDTGFPSGFGAGPGPVEGDRDHVAAGPALRAPVRPAGCSVAPVLLAAQTGRPEQAGWPEWSGTSALDTAELSSYRR